MFTIGEVLGTGWEKFKKNAGVLIGSVVIMIVISMVVNVVLSLGLGLVAGKANSAVVALLVQLVITAVSMVINTFFILGLLAICLKALNDQPAEIGDLFGHADKLLQGLIVSVLVGIAVTIGFILLIIPGIIIGMLTCLSMWYVVDKELDAITAIKASVEATKGALGPLFLFGLAGFFLAIPVVFCTLGIGMLIYMPVMYLSWGAIYMSLSKASDTAAAV